MNFGMYEVRKQSIQIYIYNILVMSAMQEGVSKLYKFSGLILIKLLCIVLSTIQKYIQFCFMKLLESLFYSL